jgi:hypothetical protein
MWYWINLKITFGEKFMCILSRHYLYAKKCPLNFRCLRLLTLSNWELVQKSRLIRYVIKFLWPRYSHRQAYLLSRQYKTLKRQWHRRYTDIWISNFSKIRDHAHLRQMAVYSINQTQLNLLGNLSEENSVCVRWISHRHRYTGSTMKIESSVCLSLDDVIFCVTDDDQPLITEDGIKLYDKTLIRNNWQMCLFSVHFDHSTDPL